MLWQKFETIAARSLMALPNEVLRAFGEDVKRERVLDPKVKAALLLAKIKPRLENLPPVQARTLFEFIVSLFDLPKAEIARVEDFTIAGVSGRVPVRLYSSSDRSELLPCLIYYHGGGFVIGSLETHDHALRYLSRLTGCAILAVDYRLAPEHAFPASWEDAYSAYKWVRSSGKAVGLDPKKVAVGGDSAGGNLAISISTRAKKDKITAPIFQILFYPWIDLSQERKSIEEFEKGYGLTRDLLRYFKKHSFANANDCLNSLATPLRLSSFSGTPLTYIQIAGFDPLQDENFAYVDLLRKANVGVEAKVYGALIHGFVNLAGKIPAAREPLMDAAVWIRKGFKLK
ncbi:alpha/beta hydrolase [Leptospira broomii]